jgi:hypothetical protein
LHFVVEGQTEETFVRELLAPELGGQGIFCDAHRVTTGRRRGKVYRGGLVSYDHLKRDLTLWMNHDRGADSWFTTMIDLYRLPSDFPGCSKSKQIADPIERVEFLEDEFKQDLNHQRFLPYIQLHEFEALLFADLQSFSVAFPNTGAELVKLETIRSAFATPEHIDDGPETSPAKHIRRILPQYVKPSSGALIVSRIGLAKLRSTCLHFDKWLNRLQDAASD